MKANRVPLIGGALLLLISVLVLSIWPREQGCAECIAQLQKHNQILGALYDQRSDDAIAEDMQHVDPVVLSLEEWLERGPEKIDLQGWDDATLPDRINLFAQQFELFAQQIRNTYSDQARLKFRYKTLASTIGKLKLKNRQQRLYPLEKVQDLFGFRLVFDDLDDVAPAVEALEARYKVIDKDDYYADPQATGYRSVHLILDVDGLIVEGQIRSRGADIWVMWVHDMFYKGYDRITEAVGQTRFQEFQDYTVAFAEYIYRLESGEEVTEPPAPEGIEVLYELAPEKSKPFLTRRGIPNVELLHR